MACSSSWSNSMDKLRCSYHPEANLIDDYHTGDMICSECGLVVGDRIIDPSNEWRRFSDEKSKTDMCRVGSMDPFMQDMDLSTIKQSLPGTHRGASAPTNNDLITSFPCHFLGQTSYDRTTPFFKMDTNTRKLMFGFAEISTMADRINAPTSILNHAKNIFKRVQESNKLKNRSVDAKATACLYIACRQEGVPRTFKELCAVSSVSKKEIGRCFKLIVNDLASSLDHITSEDFMSRFCSNLRLPLAVQKSATEIAQTAFQLDLVSGLSPISVAAAAIYMASQVSETVISGKEIAEIAGVADITIRKAYRLMLPFAEELFPKNSIFYRNISLLPTL
ncbi:transcription initiation factor IIB-like isoform X1 [Anopheles funestus]|uniref:transcription initiation factor IIB-like isoform X1 n=1 Tax=Anopheles funestus TaxID=62324 RepID=UPI0020C634C9|nr:transcription initiation factor IIB-like isoform X1 [Anopheles funestus]